MQAALALLCLGIGLGAIARAWGDPRVDVRFVRGSLFSILIFALFAGMGFAAMFLVWPPPPREAAIGLTLLAWLGWLALGGLWLVRRAPRLKELPAWVLRPWGWPDVVLIALVLSALLLARLA